MSKVVFDFSGENYVVTGASSGMGRQVAMELAAAGAKVLIMARRELILQELKEQYPENIYVAALDVCDSEAMENVVKNFVATNGKLKGAVHAAGIADLTPLKAYDKEKARQIMDVSFWAGMDLVQIAAKSKYSCVGASYVMFSSANAQYAAKGMFAYTGAKAAINAALKSVAKEIAKRHQRINAVMPGWVETGMTDNLGVISNTPEIVSHELLGTGSSSDVSGMVLFLLSDMAKWITGTSVAVDGGFLA